VSFLNKPATCAKLQEPKAIITCSLVLDDHNSTNGSSRSGTSSPRSPGVAHASLHCTAPGASQVAVTVAINETYLKQHAVNFTGVTIVPGSSCQQQADGATTYPLLQFCGSQTLQLLQPIVQHVWLQNASESDWSGAVVAFGGHVTAAISAGWFAGSAAAYVLLAQGNARVTVSESVFRSNTGSVAAVGGSTLHVLSCLFANNHARTGGGLHVFGTANVSINSSILSNNTADDSPAVLADERSTVGIFHSLISNHSGAESADGCTGAVHATGSSRLTVINSTFRHNLANEVGWGGAMCLVEGSHTSISNSAFELNIGGFGAAIFMAGVRLTVSDTEFRHNEGNDGGVAHVKGNCAFAQVMTAANSCPNCHCGTPACGTCIAQAT
jgi:hypothetical protein